MGKVKLGWGYLLFARRTDGLEIVALAPCGFNIHVQARPLPYRRKSFPLFPTLATVN